MDDDDPGSKTYHRIYVALEPTSLSVLQLNSMRHKLATRLPAGRGF